MPALLSGLRIAGTWPQNPTELLIALRGPGQDGLIAEDPRLEHVRWSECETVFSRARSRGARSAMVGWYHPYARIVGHHLESCVWYEDRPAAFSTRESLAGAYSDHFRGLLETARYSVFGQSLAVRKSVWQHEEIRRRATALVGAQHYDLVLIHWPIPHLPFFYDVHRGTCVAANRGPHGYLDSLVLADRMLGELLNELDDSGASPSSAVIVTSDHWWRAAASYDGISDHRVPFIVRLPTDARSVCWERRFETVNTGDLILAMLDGQVATMNDLADWLATASSFSARQAQSGAVQAPQ